MAKVRIHIKLLSRAVLLPLLLVVSLAARSQDDDDPFVQIDTTIITQVAPPDEETHFDPVTTEVQQPVQPRPVDRTKAAQMKKDEDFWYVNTVPERPEAPIRKMPPPRKDPEWVRNLLWVLVVGGFVVLLIWFLLSSDVQLFRRKPPVVERPEDEEEYTTENLFDIDYESALKRAVAAQNYRLAIRLMYLQTLKELALRNIIQYRQERTNSDYLMQLFQTAYYKDFFRLTRNFEYAWYGNFAVSPTSFEQIRQEFTNFKHRMFS